MFASNECLTPSHKSPLQQVPCCLPCLLGILQHSSEHLPWTGEHMLGGEQCKIQLNSQLELRKQSLKLCPMAKVLLSYVIAQGPGSLMTVSGSIPKQNECSLLGRRG